MKNKERNETQWKTKGRHNTVGKSDSLSFSKKCMHSFPLFFFSVGHLMAIMLHRNNLKSTGEQHEQLMGKGINEDKQL